MVAQLLVAGLLFATPPVAPEQEPIAGRVVASRGQATVLRKHKLLPLKRGDVLYEADEVETAENGGVRILLQDNSVLDIAPNSDMKLEAFVYRPKSQSRVAKLTMFIGKLWARVTPNTGNNEQNFSITTPNAVAGVRGTSLQVGVSGKGESQVTVVNGQVAVRDSGGATQTLGPSMQTVVNNQGQTVNTQVNAATINQFRSATSVKPSLGTDGSSNRLDVANTAIISNNSAPVSAPPPARPAQTPRDTGSATNMAPPIDLDPSKNIARVTLQIHIKDSQP